MLPRLALYAVAGLFTVEGLLAFRSVILCTVSLLLGAATALAAYTKGDKA